MVSVYLLAKNTHFDSNKITFLRLSSKMKSEMDGRIFGESRTGMRSGRVCTPRICHRKCRKLKLGAQLPPWGLGKSVVRKGADFWEEVGKVVVMCRGIPYEQLIYVP